MFSLKDKCAVKGYDSLPQPKNIKLHFSLTFNPLLQPLTASLICSASQPLICTLVYRLSLVFPLTDRHSSYNHHSAGGKYPACFAAVGVITKSKCPLTGDNSVCADAQSTSRSAHLLLLSLLSVLVSNMFSSNTLSATCSLR